jgi:hypothetical protein
MRVLRRLLAGGEKRSYLPTWLQVVAYAMESKAKAFLCL